VDKNGAAEGFGIFRDFSILTFNCANSAKYLGIQYSRHFEHFVHCEKCSPV